MRDGDADRGGVEATLRELARSDLIQPARTSSMEGQAEFAFRHALVRDVCYGQLAARRAGGRSRRRRRVDQKMAGDRIEDRADILAAHYRTAIELRARIRLRTPASWSGRPRTS